MNPSLEPAYSTADLFDATPDLVQVCDLQFRSIGARRSFAGPCATVRVTDHLGVRHCLEEQGHGRVLVVQPQSPDLRIALLGDRLAGLAIENGWNAVVVNGYIRDSEVLREMRLGVMALGTTARRHAAPEERYWCGQSLDIGGVRFTPGNWIVSDADALIVCPKDVFSELYA